MTNNTKKIKYTVQQKGNYCMLFIISYHFSAITYLAKTKLSGIINEHRPF